MLLSSLCESSSPTTACFRRKWKARHFLESEKNRFLLLVVHSPHPTEEIPTGADADGPRFNGYQLLSHLLHTKRKLLDTKTLEILLGWAGMEATHPTEGKSAALPGHGREGVLANPFVFRHLLLELHMWDGSTVVLQTIFQRIFDLVSTDNIHQKYNLHRCSPRPPLCRLPLR